MKTGFRSLKSLFLLITALAIVLSSGSAFALDPLRTPYAGIGVEQLPLKIQIDNASVQRHTRTPIRFHPITLEELQSRTGMKGLKLTTLINIPPEYANDKKGVRMRVDNILTFLNEQEMKLNLQGYSLRDPTAEIEIQSNIIDQTKVEMSRIQTENSNRSYDPSTMFMAWGSRPVAVDKPILDRTIAGRLTEIRNAFNPYIDIDYANVKTLSLDQPFAWKQNPNTLHKVSETTPPVAFGDPKTMAIVSSTTWTADGTWEKLTVEHTADTKVFVFNHGLEIIRVTGKAEASSGLKKTVPNAASYDVFVAGYKLYDVRPTTGSNPIYHEQDQSISKGWGVSSTFTIGPIPVTIEAGWTGQIGSTISLIAAPSYVKATVTPYVSTNAYARCAVNVVLIKAGVEGILQLLYLDSEEGGWVEMVHKGENDIPMYHYQLYRLNTVNALKGNIGAFVKVWYIFGSKKYKWKIVKYDGLTISEKYPINNEDTVAVFPININYSPIAPAPLPSPQPLQSPTKQLKF